MRSWNTIILPNALNLGEFEGINGTCRTLQSPANSRCCCSYDWCFLPSCWWEVFIFNFALSVRKIHHGERMLRDSYRFSLIDITAKVPRVFLKDLLFFRFAIRAKRCMFMESATRAQRRWMWAEFNSFTDTGAVSADMTASQWEEGSQIRLGKIQTGPRFSWQESVLLFNMAAKGT